MIYHQFTYNTEFALLVYIYHIPDFIYTLQKILSLFAYTKHFYIHIRSVLTLILNRNDDKHQPKHTSREDLASHSKPGSFLFKTMYVSDLPISSIITASQKPTILRTSMAAVGRYTKQQILTAKQN